MIKKIISGGQTGVDRAALDIAIKLGINHGGWCPKGRKAEDGKISEVYQLEETKSDHYSERTKLNIRDADGTLILIPTNPSKITDGTILTIQEVVDKNKPYFICDLSSKNDFTAELKHWIFTNNIKILNVAGPRESQSPGIYNKATQLLQGIVEKITKNNSNNIHSESFTPKLRI